MDLIFFILLLKIASKLIGEDNRLLLGDFPPAPLVAAIVAIAAFGADFFFDGPLLLEEDATTLFFGLEVFLFLVL